MPTALSLDLYQLTMAGGYYVHDCTGRATFELSVRELPRERGYLVAAGLEPALEFLEQLRFSTDDIARLRTIPALGRLPAAFFDDYLADFRFTGEVWALPEGTPVFPREPLLRVTAPLPEAQIVETPLLSMMLFQTSVASKAARVVQAARGRSVVEFGARRAHGTEAAVLAARAAYLAGCTGTSLVDAWRRFGVPVSGTMAHSWIMSQPSEMEAFRRYMDLYGSDAVLLVDTFDTLQAVRQIAVAGLKPAGVRLDSGDLATLSRAVRQVLDEAGLDATRILASGDLDEHRVTALVDGGAPIDAFGVGTSVTTSIDAPALAGVYKLVETERDGQRAPTLKLSPHKTTLPGRKQVWRIGSGADVICDVLGTDGDPDPEEGTPLLECVMREGRRTRTAPSLAGLREQAGAAVGRLPMSVRRLRDPTVYPVHVSDGLRRLADAEARRVRSSLQ